MGSVMLLLVTWPDLRPYTTGTLYGGKYAHDHLLQAVCLAARGNAIQHLAKDEAAHFVEFAGQPQLHQHAINAKRLLANIFYEEDGVVRMDLKGRSQ